MIKQELIDKVMAIYKDTKEKNQITPAEITPIDYIDKEKINKEEKKHLEKIGENIIKNNQYAVVTMAGGQGTRLGFDGPKGTFKLDIGKDGKYIFEILTENLKKSEQLYGILPYWYIMTSNQNNDQTIRFFEEHSFFGYEKEKIKFFKQGELPLLTPEGELVIENGKIKMAANGNGGVYEALKTEGIINDMKKQSVKWVYFCNVDNIMVNPIDPLFIGLTIKNNFKLSGKSVIKAYPEEKVGAFCKRNGKPSIVEYVELSDEMINLKNEENELIYGEANITNYLLHIDTIEKIANHNLKYHIAVKKGLYKFETFIFDGFEYVEDMLVMRVKREEEFAPIKNKEGIDSPETAKQIYLKNKN